jgi:quercetin dioxygenase-like cupin family protein
MKPKLLLAVFAVALTAVGVYAGTVLATPPQGVTTITYGIGRFAPIDAKAKTGAWKARIKTKGDSDVHVLQNTIIPGGTFGWHSHPGPSLVIVKSGTATFYMGDDPNCMRHVVPAGGSFVDDGGQVHVVRNEGDVDLVTVVVSLVPAGAARRIDEPDPGTCPN